MRRPNQLPPRSAPGASESVSAPASPLPRRSAGGLRRIQSSHAIIQLTESGAYQDQGWCFDTSKTRGHIVCLEEGFVAKVVAVFSSFFPSSNEFWNVHTEVVPLLFFLAAALSIRWTASAPATATIQQAIEGTLWGTTLQHACSLFAHVGYRASARLSHAIWYVDYAGILLNFVWNSPPLFFAMAPWLEALWPAWYHMNLLTTALIMGGGLWLACTQPIPAVRDGSGSETSFFAVFLRSPAAFVLLLSTCGLSLGATALIPFYGTVARSTSMAVLPCLGLSLAIKLSSFPERWLVGVSTASSNSSFDLSFSPFHSHSLWHLGVWGVQLLYFYFFSQVLVGRDSDAMTAAQCEEVIETHSRNAPLTRYAAMAGWD